MNETKHTPGPWKLGYYADSGKGKERHTVWQAIATEATGFSVAIVSAYQQPFSGEPSRGRFRQIKESERLANARLIAAAPELLKAGLHVSKVLRQMSFQRGTGIWSAAKIKADLEGLVEHLEQAIAKAEGSDKP